MKKSKPQIKKDDAGIIIKKHIKEGKEFSEFYSQNLSISEIVFMMEQFIHNIFSGKYNKPFDQCDKPEL